MNALVILGYSSVYLCPICCIKRLKQQVTQQKQFQVLIDNLLKLVNQITFSQQHKWQPHVQPPNRALSPVVQQHFLRRGTPISFQPNSFTAQRRGWIFQLRRVRIFLLFLFILSSHDICHFVVMARNRTTVAFLFYPEARPGHDQVDRLIPKSILQVRIYNI